jgi:hypothetical protein
MDRLLYHNHHSLVHNLREIYRCGSDVNHGAFAITIESIQPAATTTNPWVPDVGIPDHLPRPTSEHQEDTQGEDPSNH